MPDSACDESSYYFLQSKLANRRPCAPDLVRRMRDLPALQNRRTREIFPIDQHLPLIGFQQSHDHPNQFILPIPSTPAIPAISPARTWILTFSSACRLFLSFQGYILKVEDDLAPLMMFSERFEDHLSANHHLSQHVFGRTFGFNGIDFFPLRRTVIRSVSSSTSSRWCEM